MNRIRKRGDISHLPSSISGYGSTTYWGADNWIVRWNPGGTNSWQPLDNFQFAAGESSSAAAIVANASGNVFVGGTGGSSSSDHWLVRKH